MTPLEILKTGRELLSDPSRWTQGTFYRNRFGNATCHRKSAVQFCALGAVTAASGDRRRNGKALADAYRLLERAASPQSVVAINDSSVNKTASHRAVLRLYDKAIKAASHDEAKRVAA